MRTAVAIGLVMALPAAARATDIQGRRYYLAVRYAESNPLSDAHDAVGLSLGMNWNRYLGFELAGDVYEVRSDISGVGVIGDLGTGAIIPQARLRYPFLRDRLVPYLIGGAGVGIVQFNDRKAVAGGHAVDVDGSAVPMGSVGGGIEYHVADNVALGIEGKYLIAGDQTVAFDGVDHETSLSAGLVALSIRLLYPQLDPDHAATSGASGSSNFYFGVRAGAGMPVRKRVFGGVEARPEPANIGGIYNQLYGAVLGVNLGRHLGVELPFEGYEMTLAQPGVATLGEYALYSIVPQLRLRHPLSDRLEPYLLGGVGVTYGEFNDRNPTSEFLGDIDANDLGIGATIGGGVEYFLATNIALSAEARYLFARGHHLRIGAGPEMSGDLDSLLLTIGLRVFLFEWGRGI